MGINEHLKYLDASLEVENVGKNCSSLNFEKGNIKSKLVYDKYSTIPAFIFNYTQTTKHKDVRQAGFNRV